MLEPDRPTLTIDNQGNYHGPAALVAKYTIARYRTQHGDICPGIEQPHEIKPRNWTHTPEHGPLCRSCRRRAQ